MEEYDVNNFSRDLYKEVNNVSIGKALTSFSKMINKHFFMTVPAIKTLEFNEISSYFQNIEDLHVGVVSKFAGELDAHALFIMKPEVAKKTIKLLLNKEVNDLTNLNELEESVLVEVGNILFNACAFSIDRMINKKVKATIPYVCVDMLGALLSIPAIEFAENTEGLLVVKTDFASKDAEIEGWFLITGAAEMLTNTPIQYGDFN